jgi:hypothetical protein
MLSRPHGEAASSKDASYRAAAGRVADEIHSLPLVDRAGRWAGLGRSRLRRAQPGRADCQNGLAGDGDAEVGESAEVGR